LAGELSKWKYVPTRSILPREPMNLIHGDQLLTPLNWRYATKEFDPARKISPED